MDNNDIIAALTRKNLEQEGRIDCLNKELARLQRSHDEVQDVIARISRAANYSGHVRNLCNIVVDRLTGKRKG